MKRPTVKRPRFEVGDRVFWIQDSRFSGVVLRLTTDSPAYRYLVHWSDDVVLEHLEHQLSKVEAP